VSTYPIPGDPITLPGKPGMIDQLMEGAARVHEEIDQLTHILTPVRGIGFEDKASAPQDSPTNRLHEAILMIEGASQKLRALKLELHL